MNDSTTTPSPLLANLAVGDMVTHRWRYHLSPYSDGVYGSDLCGIVTDIRSQRKYANDDRMHTVVEVAWFSGPWAKDGPPTTYEVEDMRLIGNYRVASWLYNLQSTRFLLPWYSWIVGMNICEVDAALANHLIRLKPIPVHHLFTNAQEHEKFSPLRCKHK